MQRTLKTGIVQLSTYSTGQ